MSAAVRTHRVSELRIGYSHDIQRRISDKRSERLTSDRLCPCAARAPAACIPQTPPNLLQNERGGRTGALGQSKRAPGGGAEKANERRRASRGGVVSAGQLRWPVPSSEAPFLG